MQTRNDRPYGSHSRSNQHHCAVRLTHHAARRAQQRAISKAFIPLVRAYGKREFDGHGGVIYLMTFGAIDTLIRAVGRTPAVERLEGVYIVVDADDEKAVITVGHRW
jgi:hypothetical protein